MPEALIDPSWLATEIVVSDYLVQVLQKQYSPSQWTKRGEPSLIVQQHVEFATKVSEDVQKRIPFETLSYGEHETDKVDSFGGHDIPEDAPIFVYIHGGYWQELNKAISSYCVEPLINAGIRVLVPEYELAPKSSLGEIVNQIRRLFLFVLETGRSKGVKSIWFGGHSAGAHLAATLLEKEWALTVKTDLLAIFKGVVLISGIYDLRPLIKTDINDPLYLDEFRATQLSPQLYEIHPIDNFKAILSVAENDSPEFIRQTREYAQMFTGNGIKTQEILLHELDHFNIVEKLSESDFKLTQLIIKEIVFSNSQ